MLYLCIFRYFSYNQLKAMDLKIQDDSTMLHYEQVNNSSVMKAQVEAESSVVYLKAVNYVSTALKIKSELETKALAKGSVIRFFRFIVHEKNDKEILRYILMFVFNRIFYFNQTVKIEDILNNVPDDYREKVEKILQRKRITNSLLLSLYDQVNIRNIRSDFLKNLDYCRDITAFSVTNGVDYTFIDRVSFEIPALRFKEYIEVDDLSTVVKDKTTLYIISPVLLKGKELKWGGIYEGKYITFDMLSSEFKTKSQIGDIDYRTGFNVSCKLVYTEVMETPHTIKKKDFKVLEVYSYGIDDTFVETFAGKKKKAEEAMLKLFQDKDYE